MLYLVMPDRTLKWTANIGQEVLDLADANNRDLSAFDWWSEAEGTAEDDVVRVALRYGLASSTGIVVDAGHVVLVRRPSSMRETFREADEVFARTAPEIDAVDRFIDENMAPGWLEQGVELDARVRESMAESLAKADADARAELDRRSPREDLVSHWATLGGVLPSPL